MDNVGWMVVDELEDTINDYANLGWKLHTVIWVPNSGARLVFERMVKPS